MNQFQKQQSFRKTPIQMTFGKMLPFLWQLSCFFKGFDFDYSSQLTQKGVG
jgi:hypothetical protein